MKYLLNMQKGLEILGNNEQLFFDILNTYVLELDTKIATLTAAYDQGDFRTYGITAHSLKSSSQSVGVEILPDLALALENACREGNRDFVIEHHQGLLDCVDALKLELTQRFKNELFASSQVNGQKENTSPHLITQSSIDKQLLKELFDAVDLCDPKESSSILERIRLESYPAKQEEFLEELSRYIEQSNFMEAEDLLRKYAGVTSQRNEETEFARRP